MILQACNKKTEILQLSQPSLQSLYLRTQFNHVLQPMVFPLPIGGQVNAKR